MFFDTQLFFAKSDKETKNTKISKKKLFCQTERCQFMGFSDFWVLGALARAKPDLGIGGQTPY